MIPFVGVDIYIIHITTTNQGTSFKEISCKMSLKMFRGQNYNTIKKEQLKKGALFTDPEFPPNNKSFFCTKADEEIQWRRPKELCKVPKLVVEGVSCDYMSQGDYGAPWFVSACSAIHRDKKLWMKVLPNLKEQEWTEKEHSGIFHFCFWQHGGWVDVVVDDFLPTKNGELVSCHSRFRNEFWPALLEKAYAKLYGDYETMTKTSLVDALVDLTGGVGERSEVATFQDKQDDLFKVISQGHDRKDIMICTKENSSESQDAGITQGQGYIVTGVLDIQSQGQAKENLESERTQLIRLQNPWGKSEWRGPWADNSSEWNALTSKKREKCGIKLQQEGEFWIPLSDFQTHFDVIDFCHFCSTSGKRKWTESLFEGEWTMGDPQTARDRSGGGPENLSHLMNPQYVFDISEDEDELAVSMEQFDATGSRQKNDKPFNIGFQISKVQDNRTYRIHSVTEVTVTSQFIPKRNIFAKYMLKKGRYVIIPCTQSQGEVSNFLLRLFSPSALKTRELTSDCPGPGGCFGKAPVIVSKITVIGAQDLEELPQMNVYVLIKCEGETVKSQVKQNDTNPRWNFRTIFYRKKPADTIEIQILNAKKMSSDILGIATLNEIGTEDGKTSELTLYGKPKKGQSVVLPGKVSIEIASSNDLTAY